VTNPNYQRFLDSMVIDRERWHDGVGYDLEALELLDEEDRSRVETLLIQHLDDAGDWRDLEALVSLGTPDARAAVEAALNHRDTRVRRYALRTLLDDSDPERRAELEDLVVARVRRGDHELAERLPTPRVKAALLEAAREADDASRVHSAAMLLYLCGQASDPFDWSQRPFLLRFAEGDAEALRAAWEELRQRVGM
jgi:hypothetical protein